MDCDRKRGSRFELSQIVLPPTIAPKAIQLVETTPVIKMVVVCNCKCLNFQISSSNFQDFAVKSVPGLFFISANKTKSPQPISLPATYIARNPISLLSVVKSITSKELKLVIKMPEAPNRTIAEVPEAVDDKPDLKVPEPAAKVSAAATSMEL